MRPGVSLEPRQNVSVRLHTHVCTSICRYSTNTKDEKSKTKTTTSKAWSGLNTELKARKTEVGEHLVLAGND